MICTMVCSYINLPLNPLCFFFLRFCFVPIRNEMEHAFYLTLDEKLLSIGEKRPRQGKEGQRRGRDGPSHLHSLEILLLLLIPGPHYWSRKTWQAKQDICYSRHWGWESIRVSLVQVIRAIKWDVAWPCVCMCVCACARARTCVVAFCKVSVLKETMFSECSLYHYSDFLLHQYGMSWDENCWCSL